MKPLQPAPSDSDDSSAPRAHRQRRKNLKRGDRPNHNSSNPTPSEFGLVLANNNHIDKGKGKDKPLYSRSTSTSTTRPVPKSTHSNNNATTSMSTGLLSTAKKAWDPKTEIIEISSSEPDVEELDTDMIKLRRELADLKLQLAAATERARRPQKQPSLEVRLAKAQKDATDLTLERDELKKARQKDREFQEAVSNALQCHVCFNLLSRPYALNPCGHVCCLTCLQDWFKSADDGDGGEKKCPYCRASIQRKPVELFLIKSLVDALAKVDEQVAKDAADNNKPATTTTTATAKPEDPWKGIFFESTSSLSSSSSDDAESISDSEEESLYDSDEPRCENCGSTDISFAAGCMDCGHPMIFSDSDEGGHGFHHHVDEVPQVSDSEDEHLIAPPGGFNSWLVDSAEEDNNQPEDDEEENDSENEVLEDAHSSFGADSDHEHEHGTSVGDWTYASWSPRAISIPRTLLSHLSEAEYVICCRGVPLQMITKFDITYTHSRGLCAKVEAQGEDGRGTGILWLGWNVSGVGSDDPDGSNFIDDILNEMIIRPERYVIIRSGGLVTRRRVGDNTVWTAWKLVRRHGADDVDYGSDAESV